MKVKVIKFEEDAKMPERAHYNDAGLDCFASESVVIEAHYRKRVKLGFGLELPDGYAAFVLPRSSMNAKGIRCEIGTIDSGYRGEIQAVIVNDTCKAIAVMKDDKIAQLVVMPITYIDLVDNVVNDRNENGFGSTGK